MVDRVDGGTEQVVDGTDDCDAGPVGALRTERETVDELASDDGEFVVACRRTGISPEPIDGATFETFDDAERARDAARRYRAVLRTLDPGLERYELSVSAGDGGAGSVTRVRHRTDRRRENGLPAARQTVTFTGEGCEEWLRVENGPVVHVAGPEALLDDELVTRQLDSALDPR